MSIILSKKIKISGAVQGVGFRPFVYKIATMLDLFGEVYNDSSGVIILVKCEQNTLNKFLPLLQNSLPPLAKITSVEVQDNNHDTQDYSNFKITASRAGQVSTIVLPDACVCQACIDDISDKTNRRYGYAFTNCTHCGPRFSIIKAIPYDRQSTSMSVFKMCKKCEKEYQDPLDRRFHAQPNACSDCGPQLQLTNIAGKNINTDNIIKKAASLLKQGKIVAIKGIGGFHLACLASCDSALITLRKRKYRPKKPFALMAKDVSMVREYCTVSEKEKLLLTDKASPIVLLSKIGDLLSKQIAPSQNNLGFMLPYSPLHYLLSQALNAPLVLTSGNKSHQPQIIDNQQAINELGGVADYLLLHNRDIINRVDDSVVQIVANKPRIIRHARGYAPTVLPLPKGFENSSGILAVGAELKNTFCLLTKTQAIISQHIGDLKTLENYQDFQKNISLYQQLYEVDIKKIVCDFHPDYLSSKYAQSYAQNNNIELQTVQHHHAHITSCLFEYQKPINCNNVLGIAWDGVGLGKDENLWGGEFLLANYSSFKRVAQFEYMPMLGGDKVTLEPWRMAYVYFKKYKINTDKWFVDKPTSFFDKLLNSDTTFNYTSSVGRLFDALAYVLGICNKNISYEAQASIELENFSKYL